MTSERSAEIERTVVEFLSFMRGNVCEDRASEGMVELTADRLVAEELARLLTEMELSLKA
jgi:hypothetical protein